MKMEEANSQVSESFVFLAGDPPRNPLTQATRKKHHAIEDRSGCPEQRAWNSFLGFGRRRRQSPFILGTEN